MKKVIDELGLISSPENWDPAQWDLTDLIGRILQVNGAPLFDLVVQVDDRNTSRYVLSVTLPRQSGIMPQFHSLIPKDLLHQLDSIRPNPDISHRRAKRQFVNFGDGPADILDEIPDHSFLEAAASHSDPSADLFLPDANFLQSIQVS